MGADQQWIKGTKKYILLVRKEMSNEEEFLRRLLAELELVATEVYQEEFSNAETDKI
jgi:hypothetical protein